MTPEQQQQSDKTQRLKESKRRLIASRFPENKKNNEHLPKEIQGMSAASQGRVLLHAWIDARMLGGQISENEKKQRAKQKQIEEDKSK